MATTAPIQAAPQIFTPTLAATSQPVITVTATHAENVVRAMLIADPTLGNLEITSPAPGDAFLELTSN